MSNSNSAAPEAIDSPESSVPPSAEDSGPRGLQDPLLISAALEAAISDGGKQAIAELLWYAIQLNDLKAVATFTKFINGMNDGTRE